MTKQKNIQSYSAQDILEMQPRVDEARLNAMRDEDIDYSDIPKLTDAFWAALALAPKGKKQMVSLRMDGNLLGWYRARGKGYQALMNNVLRAYAQAQEMPHGGDTHAPR